MSSVLFFLLIEPLEHLPDGFTYLCVSLATEFIRVRLKVKLQKTMRKLLVNR